jgi:hypothetical protein
MLLVKPNRPGGVGPGSDQQRTVREPAQLGQQPCADSRVLPLRAYVGVANEGHIFHRLNSHYASQLAVFLKTPELHAVPDLIAQFMPRHVRLLPVILRNHPFIRLRAIIDDLPNDLEIPLIASPDHVLSASPGA